MALQARKVSFFRTAAASLALPFALAGCETMEPAEPAEPLPERLEGHVAALASDAFGGRGTGSEGYALAGAYVADFFAEHGIAPAAPDYRQDVPLKLIGTGSVEGLITIAAGGEMLELEPGETVGFYPPTDGTGESYGAEGSGQIVFVGYGVVAPELGHDAYEGIDVAGKVVMMFGGTPEIEDPAYRVHLRRFDVKLREAARRGATGVILLDKKDREIEARTRLRANLEGGVISLGAGLDRPLPVALMASEPAGKLFETAGLELEDVTALMEEGRNVSLPFAATAQISTQASAEPLPSFNIVGVVPGNDPALAREAVVVTAHLDHLGTRSGDDDMAGEGDDEEPEDRIYNGALDNAAGTAILMEAAARLAAEGGAARPVVFAALTAEEAGLLGSAHLARNVETLGYEAVANVNIDMPVLTYPLNDIIGFGEAYSSLAEPLRLAAEEVGLVSTPDPLPQLSLFVRSDHYRFVQEGVPSLFLFNGMAGEGKANFQKFMATHYHKPSDEVTLPINWQDGAKLTELTYSLITRIADAPERPTWNEGVIFAPDLPEG